jgi:RNA polymerase sigma-70 factor (ECF subfamily)
MPLANGQGAWEIERPLKPEVHLSERSGARRQSTSDMACIPCRLELARAEGRERQAPARPSLVDRLKAGSPIALGEAFDLYHRQVRTFAQRLIGDSGAAEDLVQETFIVLPKAMGAYDGTCALKTYVLAIAAKRAKNHLRAVARRRSLAARFAEQNALGGNRSPEEDADQSQLAEILMTMLDRLPFDQRTAFVLCEIEGRTAGEAAQIVQASESTVRTRLWHAKRKLREMVAKGGA